MYCTARPTSWLTWPPRDSESGSSVLCLGCRKEEGHVYAFSLQVGRSVVDSTSLVPRPQNTRMRLRKRRVCSLVPRPRPSTRTIPNRAGVPRKSTKVPRPSFVRESREGLGPRLKGLVLLFRKRMRYKRMRVFCA